jgi:DNA-binding protein
VTSATYARTYLAYIARLFQEKHEKIVIRGMGNVVPKCISLAMLVRRRFKGLHQIVEISTNELKDNDRVRKLPLITITLSMKELDKTNIG